MGCDAADTAPGCHADTADGNSITKFPAQDVTTIRTSPVDMGMIGPESATEYIFDGQFENSL